MYELLTKKEDKGAMNTRFAGTKNMAARTRNEKRTETATGV